MLRFRTKFQIAGALLAIVLLTAACGGDPDGVANNNGIASAAETSIAATPDGAEDPPDNAASTDEDPADDGTDAPEDIEDAFALFGECMTEAGFDFVTELEGIDGGEGGIAIGGSAAVSSVEIDPQGGPIPIDDFDAEAFEEANAECSEHLQAIDAGFDLSPEQEAAFKDAQLDFSDCMSELGVEMPEFDGGTGGGVVILESAEVEVDPQTGLPSFGDDDFDFEKFNEAAEECSVVYENYPELDGVFGAPTS